MPSASPATADARDAAPSRMAGLWRSPVGRKALMAVSGFVMFLWLLGHLLGNLQAFEGAAKLDRYAQLLRAVPSLLWTVRAGLLAAFLVHVVAGIQLWAERRAARPIAYAEWHTTGTSPAARTMIWTGFLVLAYVIYHLLDLTFGVANPDFRRGEVFHNLVVSLSRGAAAAAYVVAVAAVGVHLWHGLWSMFQSVGLAGRGAMPGLKRSAAILAAIVALGFASVPLAVLFGVIGG